MKNTMFLSLAALALTAAAGTANAQSTVDSIEAKYQLQPMPQPLTIEKTFPVLGTYQLNAAQSATTDASATTAAQTVTVTLDSSNKGIVWVDGLPEGRLKAYLKQAPATYRIVAQRTESGRQIPEGTLIFDPNTNMLNIALGKAYDNANPASIFAAGADATADVAAAPATVKVKSKSGVVKSKNKVMFYTATKTETAESTSTNAAKQ